MKLLALVLGAALLLTGCGTEFVSDPPRTPRPTFTPDEQLDPPVVDPTAIGIARLGVWSTLVPLGLTDTDCTDTPPCLAPPPLDQPMQAGWYAGAKPNEDGDEYQPGEAGPAVIAGHVDGLHPDGSKGAPGIFAHLAELAKGDEIVIERNDPQTPQPPLTFVVTEVATYPKAAFPTERVYGPTDHPTLRLITCGGTFGTARPGHYDDNVVVYAEPKS